LGIEYIFVKLNSFSRSPSSTRKKHPFFSIAVSLFCDLNCLTSIWTVEGTGR
jgi:hypothetical protein